MKNILNLKNITAKASQDRPIIGAIFVYSSDGLTSGRLVIRMAENWKDY